MHTSEEKTALRNSMLERIKQIPDHLRAAESRSLSKNLLKAIPANVTVCAYFPLKTEPDLRLLIAELIERRQEVYLPVFDNQKLIFRNITSLEHLEKGDLGIPEPPINNKTLSIQDADTIIILTPGRAFDYNGNRLGRGAGGYDHWIQKQRKETTNIEIWGVCYERQIVNVVPTEDWDEKVDKVCTAREIREIEH